ncbi:Polyprenol reductase [Fusarium keratoplasticum]|uniref:Polyprenol reductase n=1 Tax=Fusarium keratoplasticum TaxID=1328300 RepID=A0ACC0R3G2_9HYPO|nr:Polyprenol reductase [Fusarium keratoplasticum]KAI8671515.1 Polyprenol reductase [Fusarium keratoplasticum]KAI8678741.1 Polyprenol reductase [Fusarium keratoplasticum]
MDLVQRSIDIASSLTPAQWCQSFFVLSAGLILFIQALPQDVRSALMDYGPRRPKDANPASGKPETSKQSFKAVRSFLKTLTNYGQVPHSWFLHFYIISVSFSAFWAWQYIQRGTVMRTIATLQDRPQESSMSLEQVFVAWLFMALQGSRRLYESLCVSKPGSSPMWFVHWALGLGYYTAMSVAVWIEGSSAILASWDSPNQPIQVPRKVPSALALYVVACLKQNQCHRYLASLKKYTLPSEGWFEYLVCPHYTCECLLYVAIAWIAAPPGQLLNKTVLCGLLFVAVNLGATAHGTRKWMANKFGADKVAKRWTMIPLVF